MDSKAVVTDIYKEFDVDQNNILSISEVVNGYVNLYETFGVKIKKEFKESISHVAEIIKISNKGEINIPKCKKKYFFYY